jgi:hypothetical protein
VRQLEVVAVSDDGTHVLLASDENATRATHSLRIDNRLQSAIRGQVDASDERRESELSPRDIQARLRAGESAEDIAKVARIALSRVMRYAGPVLSERDRIVEQAQGAVLQRARGPELSTPLGEMVEKRLAETVGLHAETVVWNARRRDDGAWIVELSYTARGGARTASWLWQPGERELSSLNSLATRLGAETAGGSTRQRRAPGAPRTAPARPSATRRAKRSAPKRVAAAPSRKRAAAKAKPKPKRARATTAKRTVAKRAPAKRPVTKRAPAKRAVTVRAPAKRAAAKSAPAKRRTSLAAKSAKRAAAAAKQQPVVAPASQRKNGRVGVPSWSDVLLGVEAPAVARGRRRS